MEKTMPGIFLAAIFSVMYIFKFDVAHALETKEFKASEIASIDGKATLLSHESIWLGLTCRSGSVGRFSNLKQVKLGDTIKHEKYSFRVGLIEVTHYLEDFKWGKDVIAKKGDTVCVIAADKSALPSEHDCDALWLRIPKCRPIQ